MDEDPCPVSEALHSLKRMERVALKGQDPCYFLQGTFLRRVGARLAQGVALLWVWNVAEPVGQGG